MAKLTLKIVRNYLDKCGYYSSIHFVEAGDDGEIVSILHFNDFNNSKFSALITYDNLIYLYNELYGSEYCSSIKDFKIKLDLMISKIG